MKKKKKNWLYALKIGLMVFVVYHLVAFFVADPAHCLVAVVKGIGTWRDWCGAALYAILLCVGAWIIPDPDKKK